jgi:hypothetical protein
MEKPENLTPLGAPVLDCEHDHECTLLTCDFCLLELPSSGAIREESADYVAHFCGLDCLEAWRREGRVRRAVHEKQ